MKNILLALLSGGLFALAWPTYGITFLIFFSFVPLLIAEYQLRSSGKSSKGKVFLLAYLSFFIRNVFTTWWIWNSTEIGGAFAILVNSLLMATVFLIYHLVAKRNSLKISTVFFVTIWISFEKFHHHWDFSWPWLTLGNVFSEKVAWVQWYEYTGIFGGSLWVLLVNVLIFIALKKLIKTKDRKIFWKRILKIGVLVFFPIIYSCWVYISYQEKGKPTEVMVLQPNIDPYSEKYSLSNTEVIRLLFRLLQGEVTEKTRFILTPETVLADGIAPEEVSQSTEAQLLRGITHQYPKLNWLVGISMYQLITDKNKITSQSNYHPRGYWYNDYNSAFLLNKTQEIPFHHKSKLVVGVENMPFQSLLKPILGDIMIDLGGTVAVKTTQKKPSVFVSDEESVAPIICYESIYGEYVTEYIKKGAQFLGVLTNDAWWGNTQGHKQLLSYTRLRAIETRKSVARSANTGISAFISQRGDIIKQLEYGKEGSLKQTLLLNDEVTTYVRYGDYIARISAFIGLGIFLMSFLKKRSEV